MDILTQLQQNRQIIQDFTETTLSAIPGMFARLTYLASLRDLSSGAHEHAGLEVLYPKEAIRQALEQCHEELFARILELPLEAQVEDLRSCLQAMQGGSVRRSSTGGTWKRIVFSCRNTRRTISKSFFARTFRRF